MALSAKDVEMLHFAVKQIDTVLEESSKDPKIAGTLAAQGKTVADLPDCLPAPLSMRISAMVVRHLLECKCHTTATEH